METRIKFGTSRESPASVAHAHLKSPRHRIASSQRNSVDLKITEPKRKLETFSNMKIARRAGVDLTVLLDLSRRTSKGISSWA